MSNLRVATRGNNKPLTMQGLSNWVLYRLKNQKIFAQLAHRHQDQIFSTEVIGDRVEIKKPFRAFVGKGRNIDTSENSPDFSPMVDETVEVRITERDRGAFRWNDEERTLEIADFGDRYLRSMVEELGEIADEEGGEELGHSFFYHVYGGNDMDTDDAQHLRQYFTEMSIPQTGRNYAIVNPYDLRKLGKELKSFDLPSNTVEQSRIRQRYKGLISGFHVFESNHIPYYEVVALQGAPKVNMGGGFEGEDLPTDGWTANKLVMKKGTVFTITGVNQVKVRGKKRMTGREMPFVCQEDVRSSGTGSATIKIGPKLNAGTLEVNGVIYKAGKNVDIKAPDNAVIKIVGNGAGGAAATRRQCIFYERDALEYVPITLVAPDAATRKGTAYDKESGITVMFLEDWKFGSVETMVRCDIMYGFKNIYPEVGGRYIGSEL